MGLMDAMVRAGANALGSAANERKSSLGTFSKARLVPVGSKSGAAPFEFMFNPDNIQMRKIVQVIESPEQGQDQGRIQFKSGKAWELTLPELIFDTYESKEDVRKVFIAKLEEFVYVDAEAHAMPRLLFEWGEFRPDFELVATALDVRYEMFLANGTPVRAKVKLTLKSYETEKKRQDASQDNALHSPDHARIYTVRRGDNLSLISQHAYDTPTEWRRIAEYNDIEDPLRLEPGARLLLPPILK